MHLEEISKEEIEKWGMPEDCTHVQAWKGNGISVLKSIDILKTVDGRTIPILHISVKGVSQTAAFDVVNYLFRGLTWDVEAGDEPEMTHFWCYEFPEEENNVTQILQNSR